MGFRRRDWKCLAVAFAVGLPVAVVGVSDAAAQVPVSYDGVDISNDGNIVAFATTAALLSQDGNGRFDVYVLDRRNRNLTLASVSVNGRSGNAASKAPSLSPDGGWVAFESNASNMVPGDGNGLSDVFLRDLSSGRTVKVSGAGPAAGNGDSAHPDVSRQGRYVAFASVATNLIAADTNGQRDVFRWRRSSGNTIRVSVNTNGKQGNLGSSLPSISDDGQRIGFATLADNWGQCPSLPGLNLSLAVRTVPARVLAIASYVDCSMSSHSWVIDEGLELSGNGTRVLASLGRAEEVSAGYGLHALDVSDDGRSLTLTWAIGGSDNHFSPYDAPSVSPEGALAAYFGEPDGFAEFRLTRTGDRHDELHPAAAVAWG